MKTMKMYWILMVIILLARCASIDVDHSTNFSKYKTFGWGKSSIKTDQLVYRGAMIDAKLKSTIKNEFEAKGLVYTSRRPDVLVSYEAQTSEKPRRSNSYFSPRFSYWYFPYAPGWYGMWWADPYWQFPYDDSYTQGTLILNIVDRRSGKQIWRGIVQGNVDNVKQLSKSITKGVKAIMKKYPVTGPDEIPVGKKPIS